MSPPDEGIHDRGSRVVWDNGPNPLYLQIGSSVFQKNFVDFLKLIVVGVKKSVIFFKYPARVPI